MTHLLRIRPLVDKEKIASWVVMLTAVDDYWVIMREGVIKRGTSSLDVFFVTDVL
jgi:hypothetical protein